LQQHLLRTTAEGGKRIDGKKYENGYNGKRLQQTAYHQLDESHLASSDINGAEIDDKTRLCSIENVCHSGTILSTV